MSDFGEFPQLANAVYFGKLNKERQAEGKGCLIF